MTARRSASTLAVAAVRVVQNPLLWGVVVGALGNRLGVKLPEPGTAFLNMMSAAVLPASLFGLGGALNEYRLSESWAQASVKSLFKLVIHPAIAYVLMVPILHVPVEYARYGVLLAAMPAGINAYVFATYYERAVNVAANVVLISTVASIGTITFWLWVLGLRLSTVISTVSAGISAHTGTLRIGMVVVGIEAGGDADVVLSRANVQHRIEADPAQIVVPGFGPGVEAGFTAIVEQVAGDVAGRNPEGPDAAADESVRELGGFLATACVCDWLSAVLALRSAPAPLAGSFTRPISSWNSAMRSGPSVSPSISFRGRPCVAVGVGRRNIAGIGSYSSRPSTPALSMVSTAPLTTTSTRSSGFTCVTRCARLP